MLFIVGDKVVSVTSLHDGVDKPLCREEGGEWFQVNGVRSSNELSVNHLDKVFWSACGVERDDDMSVGVLEQLFEERCEWDCGNVVKNDKDMWCGCKRSC